MLQILTTNVDYIYILHPKEYRFLEITKFLKLYLDSNLKLLASTKMGLDFFVMMAILFRQTFSYSIHYSCMILRINTMS